MASLGEFNAAVAELDPNREKDTFVFMGETFTVEGAIPEVLALQLGAAVSGKIGESEGLAAVWETMRCALGDDEFARWYKLAVSKYAATETFMRLALAVLEAQTGVPTEQAADSSAGQPVTSPSSSGSSTPPGLAHLRPVIEVLTG